MASGTILKQQVSSLSIEATEVSSTDYAVVVKNVLTATAPQNRPAGAYVGPFKRNGQSPTYTTFTGSYYLYVAVSGNNYATQGFVIVQGQFFVVWYQNREWSVTRIQ